MNEKKHNLPQEEEDYSIKMPRIEINHVNPHSFSLQNPIQSTNFKHTKSEQSHDAIKSNILLGILNIAIKTRNLQSDSQIEVIVPILLTLQQMKPQTKKNSTWPLI